MEKITVFGFGYGALVGQLRDGGVEHGEIILPGSIVLKADLKSSLSNTHNSHISLKTPHSFHVEKFTTRY